MGYRTVDLTGKQYNTVAPGFMTLSEDPDDDGTFRMKAIKPTAFDESSDILQLLDNTRARTIKTYFFYDGMWREDVDKWNLGDEDRFDIFQGFLGNFGAKDVAFNGAGTVLDKPIQVDCATDKLQFVMIGNPLPVDITFKDIEVVSFDESSDILQLLDETRARTIKSYIAYNGDWYDIEWNLADDDTFAANTALLGNFGSKSVILNFPGAL